MANKTASYASDEGPLLPLSLDIEIGDTCLGEGEDWAYIVETAVFSALKKAMPYGDEPAELYVEFVGNERSQQLNNDYRGKSYPTNVLSFPGIEPEKLASALEFAKKGGPPAPLGDLIISDTVVAGEAGEQSKPVKHHLTHLVVHGVLHLLGYDHMTDKDAEIMEALERDILVGLDIPDPYNPDFYEPSLNEVTL